MPFTWWLPAIRFLGFFAFSLVVVAFAFNPLNVKRFAGDLKTDSPVPFEGSKQFRWTDPILSMSALVVFPTDNPPAGRWSTSIHRVLCNRREADFVHPLYFGTHPVCCAPIGHALLEFRLRQAIANMKIFLVGVCLRWGGENGMPCPWASYNFHLLKGFSLVHLKGNILCCFF